MTDLVTGEAVVLELRLAKLASRALSVSIDVGVQLGLLFLGTLVLAGVADNVDDALAAAIGLVFSVLVIVGYPVAFETFSRGRTLGKLALGLRVVREDGGPIRFRHAFVRGLLAVVEIWLTFGSLALIVSLSSSKGKRLGDFLAGTIVVRERIPAQGAPVVAMPPALAGWARGLDLSRVPDDLALAGRQFLTRAHELAPEVRGSMGTRLAASLAACTSPPPPPGVPPSLFLAAVLAERRRRETERLSGPPPQTGRPAPQHAPPPPSYAAAPPPPSYAVAPPTREAGTDPEPPAAGGTGNPFAPPG
ncbi:MAG: RDD family protein [Actinomycetes bacterium]